MYMIKARIQEILIGQGGVGVSGEAEKKDSWEEFRLRESAIDTVFSMLGFNFRDIMEEEAKIRPDAKKLKNLEADRDRLFEERTQIYRGNYEVMRRCVKNYFPILRERYLK